MSTAERISIARPMYRDSVQRRETFFLTLLGICLFVYSTQAVSQGSVSISKENDMKERTSTMAVAIIVPGHGENVSAPYYQEVGQYFRDASIRPIYIDVDWDKESIDEVITETREKALKKLEAYEGQDIYLFGFSLGAMAAFDLAIYIDSKAQILCSLSPFYQEDLGKLPWWLQKFARHTIYKGSPKPNYPVFDESKTSITYLLIGEKERYFNEEIMAYREKTFAPVEVILVKQGRHDLSQEEYLEVVKGTIEKLK